VSAEFASWSDLLWSSKTIVFEILLRRLLRRRSPSTSTIACGTTLIDDRAICKHGGATQLGWLVAYSPRHRPSSPFGVGMVGLIGEHERICFVCNLHNLL